MTPIFLGARCSEWSYGMLWVDNDKTTLGMKWRSIGTVLNNRLFQDRLSLLSLVLLWGSHLWGLKVSARVCKHMQYIHQMISKMQFGKSASLWRSITMAENCGIWVKLMFLSDFSQHHQHQRGFKSKNLPCKQFAGILEQADPRLIHFDWCRIFPAKRIWLEFLSVLVQVQNSPALEAKKQNKT